MRETSEALKSFLLLPAEAQEGFVARHEAGLIDPVPDFDRMKAVVEERYAKTAQLPGGMTWREKEAHEARVRAGLVDRPGQRVWGAREYKPARDPFSPFEKREPLKPYPWMR